MRYPTLALIALFCAPFLRADRLDGRIQITPANGWVAAEAGHPEVTRVLSTLEYVPGDDRNASVILTVLPAELGELVRAPNGLKRLFAQMSVKYRAGQQTEPTIVEFTTAHGTGLLATFEDPSLKDAAARKRDYKWATVVLVALSDFSLVYATVFTDDIKSADLQEGLEIVRSASPSLPSMSAPSASSAAPKAALGEELVFRPTDRTYAREPQVIAGKRAAPEMDFITFSAKTVAQAAQLYADFSRKEVRVPRDLAERELSFGKGTGKVAAGYVVASLDWQLPYDGIELETVGSGAVRFRAGKSAREKMARPEQVTPAVVDAAAAAMSETRFWELIDAARQTGANDCIRTATALENALRLLTAPQILGFMLRQEERMAESYRWDLWAVAYIVNGGASDDGFEYFRGWLIAQGRQYFEAALKNPERAADRARPRDHTECEQLLYAAMKAYEAKSGQPPPVLPLKRPVEPTGKSWDESDLPRLYPALVKKFR